MESPDIASERHNGANLDRGFFSPTFEKTNPGVRARSCTSSVLQWRPTYELKIQERGFHKKDEVSAVHGSRQGELFFAVSSRTLTKRESKMGGGCGQVMTHPLRANANLKVDPRTRNFDCHHTHPASMSPNTMRR